MDDFEQELSAALRRAEAPKGFSEAVLQRAADERASQGKVLAWPAARRWSAVLAATLLVGIAVSAEVEHRRAQQREQADRQFTLAMQVTDRALEKTRDQLSRAGIRLSE